MFKFLTRKPKRQPTKVLIVIQNGEVIGTLSDSKKVVFFIVDTDRQGITRRSGPTAYAPASDIEGEVRNHIFKGYSMNYFKG